MDFWVVGTGNLRRNLNWAAEVTAALTNDQPIGNLQISVDRNGGKRSPEHKVGARLERAGGFRVAIADGKDHGGSVGGRQTYFFHNSISLVSGLEINDYCFELAPVQ